MHTKKCRERHACVFMNGSAFCSSLKRHIPQVIVKKQQLNNRILSNCTLQLLFFAQRYSESHMQAEIGFVSAYVCIACDASVEVIS